VLGVEQPAAEEPSGHRFLAWVVRHPGWPCSKGLQPVALTGDFWAPEHQHSSNHAVQERMQEAVRGSALLGASSTSFNS
jgi:hypothetical protein